MWITFDYYLDQLKKIKLGNISFNSKEEYKTTKEKLQTICRSYFVYNKILDYVYHIKDENKFKVKIEKLLNLYGNLNYDYISQDLKSFINKFTSKSFNYNEYRKFMLEEMVW